MTRKEATRVGFGSDDSSLDGIIQGDACASIADPLLCGALDAKALCPSALTGHGAVLFRCLAFVAVALFPMTVMLKNALKVMAPDFVNGQQNPILRWHIQDAAVNFQSAIFVKREPFVSTLRLIHDSEVQTVPLRPVGGFPLNDACNVPRKPFKLIPSVFHTRLRHSVRVYIIGNGFFFFVLHRPSLTT